MTNILFIFLCCCCLSINLAAEPADTNETNQTIIEDDIDKDEQVKTIYYKDKAASQTPGDASMLYNVPGLVLTETGGPLAPSILRYRGLSAARLAIDIEGISLNNPATGFMDGNAMYLFAAKNLLSHGQALSIKLPRFTEPQAKAVIGYGSQNTFKVGASAGAPFDHYSDLFFATQLAGSDGDFLFFSPDLDKNNQGTGFRRENNDQSRFQLLAKYERNTPIYSAHTLALFNTNQGGIPGFAFSPTNKLRNASIHAGLSTGIARKIGNTEFSLNLNNSVFDYQTHDASNNKEQILSSIHELSLGFKRLNLPKWMDLNFQEKFILEHAYNLNKSRVAGGISIDRESKLGGSLKPSVFSNFTMLGYSEHGLVFNKNLGISFEPLSYLSTMIRLLRTQRLPTFMEMYADNQFFSGNSELQKESIWDIELANELRLGQHTRIKVTGFLGYLSDMIIYVPYHSTKVRPINTSVARRHGVDIDLMIEPWPWLGIESKNGFLYTKVKSTNAPLPQAPSFAGLSKIRIGSDDFLALSLQSRYRGSAAANMHGTLRSDAYAMFDVLGSVQLLNAISLSLSITNVFNLKTARDTYQMPIPGTTIFGQIEMGNL